MSTVTAATLGTVSVSGGNTQIVGIGFDENNNLLGLDENGTSGDLVQILPNAPTTSQYITEPGSIAHNLAGFAVSLTGATHKTFAYTTNPTLGGHLYSNPGVTSTLGSINLNTGLFTERGALTQDSIGTPLAGNVTSIAINKSTNNVTVLTSKGVLAQYASFDATLLIPPGLTSPQPQPLGTIVDSVTHQRITITHIAYDAAGRLIGIDATNHRLDAIGTTPVSSSSTDSPSKRSLPPHSPKSAPPMPPTWPHSTSRR